MAVVQIDGYELLFNRVTFKLKLKDVPDAYIQLSGAANVPLRITPSQNGESVILQNNDTLSLVIVAHPEEEMGTIRMRQTVHGAFVALLAYSIPAKVVQQIIAYVITHADPEGAADPTVLNGGRRVKRTRRAHRARRTRAHQKKSLVQRESNGV